MYSYYNSGQHVINLDELANGKAGIVKTDKGTSLDAVLVLKFIGLTLTTEAYENGIDKSDIFVVVALTQNDTINWNPLIMYAKE